MTTLDKVVENAVDLKSHPFRKDAAPWLIILHPTIASTFPLANKQGFTYMYVHTCIVKSSNGLQNEEHQKDDLTGGQQ